MEFVSDTGKTTNIPIEKWARDHFTEDYVLHSEIDYAEIVALKEKILAVFSGIGVGWYVINPPGDGFCGIYVAEIAPQMSITPNIDFTRPFICPTKALFHNTIIEGIQSYRNTYIQLQNDLVMYIRLPIEEIDTYIREADAVEDVIYILEAFMIVPRNKSIAKRLISMYRTMLKERFIPLNNSETIRLHLDDDFTSGGLLRAEKAAEFKRIEVAGDVDIQILSFLAYAYQHNYIVLQYEKRSQMGDLNAKCTYHRLNYYQYYIGWNSGGELDYKNHSIVYDSQSDVIYKTNTSILFNDSHYVLMINVDKTVTEALIQEFKAPGGEQLWTGDAAFDSYRGLFRQLNSFLNSGGKRVKRRQLKQTVKYRNRKTLRKLYTKPRSKLQTLKLKKRNSKSKSKTKTKAKQSKAKQSKAKQSKAKH